MARKILLADDSVTAQNMGRKILTDAGYEVVTVNNGSAALKKIGDEKPAVVVLDVYMPGYSGLEVCQRIKEGRDTSGIPVLLTVGKLEPFNHDDARKVHADAFIIKPFEATELLAALSKLEAKIGATATPAKAGKSSVATMARYERMVADGEPQFGDHESGWKARLPQPVATKGHDENSSEVESNARLIASTDQAHSQQAASLESSATAGSFPNDASAAELAALAAAAASVNEISTARDNAQREFSEPRYAQAFSSSASEAGASAIAEPEEVERRRDVNETEARVETCAPFAAGSLAGAAMSGPEPESMEAAMARPGVSGPATRWIAEEVPVEPRESALVLEREMHKAFAAFAAAESGAAYEPGSVDKNDEPAFATMAPPAIGEPVPFNESSRVAEHRESEPQAAAEEAVPEARSFDERPVFSELPKPPSMPITPPSISADEPEHAISAFGGPHPFGESREEAVTEPSTVETYEENRSGSVDRESQSPVMAEKPATWADWHDIRESSPATAASPAPSPADSESEQLDTFKTLDTEIKLKSEAAMAAAAAGNSSSSAAEPDLSSVVDSMLAELKPRLMAELAKKLDKKK